MASEPRVLADWELADFEEKEFVKTSYWARSLLLTIGFHRQEAQDKISELTAEIGSLRMKLKWFEETYCTTAMAPLFTKRINGFECPHCKKPEMVKLGTQRGCLECRQFWSVEA